MNLLFLVAFENEITNIFLRVFNALRS
jgi:hypothetical protein